MDIVSNLYISFFVGNKFAQTPLTKASVKNIKSFINLNRNNILNININNIKCNNWQKKWFNRLIFFIKNNKGHIFLKFMRFYRNILPKFILKKLYA